MGIVEFLVEEKTEFFSKSKKNFCLYLTQSWDGWDTMIPIAQSVVAHLAAQQTE